MLTAFHSLSDKSINGWVTWQKRNGNKTKTYSLVMPVPICAHLSGSLTISLPSERSSRRTVQAFVYFADWSPVHSRGDHCDAVPQRTLALSVGATTTDGSSLLTFDHHYSLSTFCPLEADTPCCLHVSTNVSKCRGNVKDSDMKFGRWESMHASV